MCLCLSVTDVSVATLNLRTVGKNITYTHSHTHTQSVSAVSTIAESPQFHQFLISGVQSFSQANIVDPRQKAARKKTFLGMMKGSSLPSFKETTQKAEVVCLCIYYSQWSILKQNM